MCDIMRGDIESTSHKTSRMRSAGGRDCEPPLPEPLADFLTWPTYGTWLPGDRRGWVEYRHGWQLPRSHSPKRGAEAQPEGRCLPSRPGPAPARRIDHCQSLPGRGGLSTPSIAARTMCTSSWRATANPRRSGSSSKPGAAAAQGVAAGTGPSTLRAGLLGRGDSPEMVG